MCCDNVKLVLKSKVPQKFYKEMYSGQRASAAGKRAFICDYLNLLDQWK